MPTLRLEWSGALHVIMPIIVIVSFLFMALSDALKMRGRDKAGKGLFAAGVLLLAAGMILSAMTGNRFHVSPLLRALLITLAALGAWGEYSSLFGALPVKETYIGTYPAQKLVDSGLYAMCRHPGAIFFPLMSVCLALGLGSVSLLNSSLLASSLNLLYVLFQDQVVFPATIPGYGSYRQRVPFLLPTAQSIARALGRSTD